MPAPPLWLLATLSLAVGFGLALAWRHWALRRGVLDAPDERRLHAAPTPRGGGIGIALAPLAKGLLQAAGAACLAAAFPLLPGLWGEPVGHVLAWALVLVLVNFWNFMDGSNGMAASQALFAALGLAVLVPASGPFQVLRALRFLPLNFPRARLFLGDVGSHALGYAIAALALMATGVLGEAPWLVLLPVSAIMLDAGLTLLSRARRRQVLWRAHREHLYQRAVAQGWSHAGICGLYAAWTLAAIALAAWLLGQPAPWAAAGSGMVLGFGIIAYSLLGRAWPRPAATGRSSHGSPAG